MTPQEQKLVADLFDRLATLESAPRDEGAVDAINAGLDRAPNALYPLVQTVLVQDEALKRADARIRELEARLGDAAEQPPGGFLDTMRDSLFGRREPQGSVPSVPPAADRSGADTWGPAYNRSGDSRDAWARQDRGPAGQPPVGQPPLGQPGPQPSAGGSFLGTAAATVAGVVGGALLMNSFRDMFGGQKGQAQSAFDQPGGAGTQPWGPDARNSDLARDAGLGDIGGGGRQAASDDSQGERAGLFDVAQNQYEDDYNNAGDFDGDFGSSDA
jgi:hypothetical protein